MKESQVMAQKTEIRLLKEEIEFLKNSCRTSTDRATAGIRSIKTCRIYMEKNLDFKENLNSRLIKFMSRNKKLIVSQKSSTSALFAGNGLKLIDFATYRAEKFINACSNVVADFSIDASETYFVAASKETTCKMYQIATATSSCSFSPPSNSPIWSCAFDHNRTDSLYLGCQNGVVYIYDKRRSTEVMKEIKNDQARSPVKFTIAIKPNANFESGGFFTVHVRGVFFYEYLPSGEIGRTCLNINEPILTMTYDERTAFQCSTRSTATTEPPPTSQTSRGQHKSKSPTDSSSLATSKTPKCSRRGRHRWIFFMNCTSLPIPSMTCAPSTSTTPAGLRLCRIHVVACTKSWSATD
jgi:hypothetical protein